MPCTFVPRTFSRCLALPRTARTASTFAPSAPIHTHHPHPTTLTPHSSTRIPHPVSLTPHPSPLTEHFSAAASNENLTALLGVLLTPALLSLLPSEQQRALQVHDCGTVLEACVSRVYAAGNTAAIAALARFLVDNSKTHAVVIDAISKLTELKGTLDADEGSGPPHARVFEAVAHIGVRVARAQGHSKKVAKQSAAGKLLEQMGVETKKQPTRRLAFERQVASANNTGGEAPETAGQQLTFTPFLFPESMMTSNLKNDERPETWFGRDPTDLHRCMLAQRIWPLVVHEVAAWQTQLAAGWITMISVTATDEAVGTLFFTNSVPALNKTQAKKAASTLAHAHLVELLRVQGRAQAYFYP